MVFSNATQSLLNADFVRAHDKNAWQFFVSTQGTNGAKNVELVSTITDEQLTASKTPTEHLIKEQYERMRHEMQQVELMRLLEENRMLQERIAPESKNARWYHTNAAGRYLESVLGTPKPEKPRPPSVPLQAARPDKQKWKYANL